MFVDLFDDYLFEFMQLPSFGIYNIAAFVLLFRLPRLSYCISYSKNKRAQARIIVIVCGLWQVVEEFGQCEGSTSTTLLRKYLTITTSGA